MEFNSGFKGLTAMTIGHLSQNRQANRPFTRKIATYVLEQLAVRMWKKCNLPRIGITGGIFMRGNEILGFIKERNFTNRFSVSCIPQSAIYLLFYLIILFNLIVPKLLSLVGGTLSGNGCGSPKHIHYLLFLFTC